MKLLLFALLSQLAFANTEDIPEELLPYVEKPRFEGSQLSQKTPGKHWRPMDPWIHAYEQPTMVPNSFGESTLNFRTAIAVEKSQPWKIYNQTDFIQPKPGDMVNFNVSYALEEGSEAVWLELLDLGEGVQENLRVLSSMKLTAPVPPEATAVILPVKGGPWGLRVRGEGTAVLWLYEASLVVTAPASWAANGPVTKKIADLVLKADTKSFTLTQGKNRPWHFIWPKDGSQWRLNADSPDSPIVMSGVGPKGEPLSRNFYLSDKLWIMSDGPASLVPSPELEAEDRWVLPMNQGAILEQSELKRIWQHEIPMEAGHFVSMPWTGVLRPKESLMVLPGRGEDLDWPIPLVDLFWRSQRQGEGFGLSWHRFDSWQKKWGFQISIGPSSIAWMPKRYRQEHSMKLFSPLLADKQKRRPGISRLSGAVNIWWWKNGGIWQQQGDVQALAAEIRSSGFDRVLWSQAADAASVKAMKEQGWLAGRYENFQDVYPSDTPLNWVNKDGWPEQAMLKRDGSWLKGWPAKQGNKTYYAGVRCPQPGQTYAKEQLNKGNAERGYNAVFLDTTTASAPRECFHPEHGEDRKGDQRSRLNQLDEAKRQGLVTGSESGFAAALPHVDYFEGMQSPSFGRLPDSGYDLFSRPEPTRDFLDFMISPRTRVPLFELAFHDSYVGYEYWGDAANRLPQYWRRRDLFSVLYAQPQLWIMDEARWKEQKVQALKSYQTWSPIVRHLFGQKMMDWRWVDKTGQVQETHWEDGSVVRVDFAKDKIILDGPVRKSAAQGRN